MAYTKIPFSNIAGSLGQTVGAALGKISTTGNEALDRVEDLLSGGRKTVADIRQLIKSTQERANIDASLCLERAVRSVSTGLNNKVQSAYTQFLERTVDMPVANALVQEGGEQLKNLQDRAKGEIIAFAQKEADEIKAKALEEIKALQQQIQASVADIKKAADVILGGIETGLTAIITVSQTIRTTLTAVRIPIVALKVAITALKASLGLLPQRWLLVIFTIIQQDTLDTLEELITQAEETIKALEAILENIENTLTPLRDRIRRIRASLSLFQIDAILSDATGQDWQILSDAGLLDGNESVFDVIGDGLQDGDPWKGFGIDPDFTIPDIGNQLIVVNPGDSIVIPGVPSGSYFEDYYIRGKEKPDPTQGDWSKIPPDGDDLLWSTSIQMSDGHTIGTFSDPVETDYLDALNRKTFNAGETTVPVIDGNSLDKKPGIIKSSNWEETLDQALTILKDLPLSRELQDKLVDLWDIETSYEAGTADLKNGKIKYVTANGEVYYLEVVEDSRSPKVATRRFVRVTDVGDVVILEGTKTFSLDKESLLTEMKLELELLTR